MPEGVVKTNPVPYHRLNSFLSYFRFETTSAMIILVLILMPYLNLFYRFVVTLVAKNDLPVIFSIRTFKLLGSSLGLSFVVSITSISVAIILLYMLWKIKSPFSRNMILFILVFLFCLSPLIQLIGWQRISFFYTLPPFFCVTLIFTWNLFPLVLFILISGLMTIDKACIEAGLMICDKKNLIRFIIIPKMLPVILLAGIVAALLAFVQMEVPALLGFTVYSEEFLSRLIIEDDLGAAMWLSTPFYITGIVATGLILFLWPNNSMTTWQKNGLSVLKNVARPFKHESLVSLFVIIILCIPIFLLLMGVYSVNWVDFFLNNYLAIYSSFKLAVLGVLIAIPAAYLIVDGLTLLRRKYLILALGLFCMLVLLPGSLLGLGMQDVSQYTGFLWFKNGDLLLIFTHSIKILPYGVLLFFGFKWLDHSSQGDDVFMPGISWIHRKRFIDLPNEIHRIITISGILFVITLSEVSTTILVISPGTQTIILKLYNLLHYGAYDTVIALALVQAGIVLVLMAALYRFVRRNTHDSYE